MQTNSFTTPVSHQMQQHKKSNCFTSIGKALKRFNPCLRPQQQSESLTKFLQQFRQVSLYDDPYFGQVFLLQSITHNQQILLKKQKMTVNQAIERQKQIRQLESYKNNNNLVSQVLLQKITKTGFLWTKIEMYLVYDFIVFDLQKQFEYRLAKNTNFSQRQIISIIRGSCKGYIHLQSTDYSSIRMSYIYFTRKGQVKIAHPNLFHYKSNLQNICQHDESKGIYLSPQQMICLQKGEKNAILGWKSNSYVFGMVLLSLMSGSHLNQVYDYSACYIDRVKVQQLLRNTKQVYSERLVNYVQKLIQQRPQDRINFRNLLSKTSQTVDAGHEVALQLLTNEARPIQYLPNYGQGLTPNIDINPINSIGGVNSTPIQAIPGQTYATATQPFQVQSGINNTPNYLSNNNNSASSSNYNSAYTGYNHNNREPQHINYLAGLVYPKVGLTGQFYNDSPVVEDPAYKYSTLGMNNSNRIGGMEESSIVAQQRHFYQNRNSSYIGDGKIATSLIQGQNMQNGEGKPIRQGKGMYQNADGQFYVGDWKKGQMEGYGKLYWNQKKIRYEGQFKNGKFHGRGTQYNGDPNYVGMVEPGDEPDHTFVRLQRNNWIKYEGGFNNDVKEGQGIAYFKNGKWMGNFRGGQPNGHGVFYDNTGTQTRGVWIDGIQQM